MKYVYQSHPPCPYTTLILKRSKIHEEQPRARHLNLFFELLMYSSTKRKNKHQMGEIYNPVLYKILIILIKRSKG